MRTNIDQDHHIDTYRSFTVPIVGSQLNGIDCTKQCDEGGYDLHGAYNNNNDDNDCFVALFQPARDNSKSEIFAKRRPLEILLSISLYPYEFDFIAVLQSIPK